MFRETPCIFFYVVTTAFAGFCCFVWMELLFQNVFCFVATLQISSSARKVVNGNDKFSVCLACCSDLIFLICWRIIDPIIMAT